jgi:hypothetical protein
MQALSHNLPFSKHQKNFAYLSDLGLGLGPLVCTYLTLNDVVFP